jgi:hypothetical protein
MIVQAKVVALHWEDLKVASQTATLEVEHSNGDRQYFVIQIVRMSERVGAGNGAPDKPQAST